MASDFGSVFHFAGRIQDMKLKIVLTRKGPSLDFALEPTIATAVVCDEVNCNWLEVISRKVNPEYDRSEPRIFTTIEKDENVDETKKGRKVMNVFAYLGDLNDTSETTFHDALICRLTVFNDKTLTFEPPLTTSGYQLESKLGDYTAKVQVWDDQFASLMEGFSRLDLGHLPDAGVFDLGEEQSLTITHNITIATGSNFDFDGISIRWKLLGNAEKSSQMSGTTSRCFRNSDEIFKFSHIFTISLSIPFSVLWSGFTNPTLILEAISEDSWGRQWIAGYACVTLPMNQGNHKQEAHCWRPIKKDSMAQLAEFFIGSAVELDANTMTKDGFCKMFGMHTEASGSIDLEIMTIVHSRHFMSKDTLQHVKYGTKLGQIGLKSDLYWRIMKVLLEFEEARQALLHVRQA